MKKSTILGIVMVLFVVGYLFPYIWLILTSFKTRADALSVIPKIIFKPTLSNYINVFLERGFLRYLANSFIIASISSALVTLLAYPASYTFSRMKLRGDNHIFFVIF